MRLRTNLARKPEVLPPGASRVAAAAAAAVCQQRLQFTLQQDGCATRSSNEFDFFSNKLCQKEAIQLISTSLSVALLRSYTHTATLSWVRSFKPSPSTGENPKVQ